MVDHFPLCAETLYFVAYPAEYRYISFRTDILVFQSTQNGHELWIFVSEDFLNGTTNTYMPSLRHLFALLDLLLSSRQCQWSFLLARHTAHNGILF
jgi:hypothetical protein